MVKLIIPPLFSLKGKLNIGQAMTLVISDSIIRYYEQKGDEVFFHSKAYNSQGLPMEELIGPKIVASKDYIKLCNIKANELIDNIEKDKERLGLTQKDSEYLDHSALSGELSQTKFIELVSKKDIFYKEKNYYLDSEKIIKNPLFKNIVNQIRFTPNSFRGKLEQLIENIDAPLQLSRRREFATPIPKLKGKETEELSCIDPLWNLAMQQFSLKDSYPRIQICGLNMATRYIFYTLITNFGLQNKPPFDQIIVHNILNDNKGVRMSNLNNNLMNICEISKEYHSDAIRYAILKAISFNKESVNFSKNFLDEGQKAVYRMGNLRKFFMKHNIPFEKLPLKSKYLEEFNKKMSELNIRGGFDISQECLQKLSSKIKKEHDSKSLSKLELKAIKYKAGVFMAYPFMPSICLKSKDELKISYS